MRSIQFSQNVRTQKCSKWGLFSFHRIGRKWSNGVYSVFTEPYEYGTDRKVLLFYGRNSEDNFVGACAVEKSTAKGVEKSRLQAVIGIGGEFT